MAKKLSIPIGMLEVIVSTASPREVHKSGSKEFAEVDGITFVKLGQKVILRAIDGIIIATGKRHMVVTNTQDPHIVNGVIAEFRKHQISVGEIDMFVQFPISGTEEPIMSQARQAGVRTVWMMNAIGDAPPNRRKQKYVMVKRSV